MRILIENAMNFMPFKDATVTTPTMEKYILTHFLRYKIILKLRLSRNLYE